MNAKDPLTFQVQTCNFLLIYVHVFLKDAYLPIQLAKDQLATHQPDNFMSRNKELISKKLKKIAILALYDLS